MSKIVIIEDETELLENLKFIFELDGYSVKAFDNGQDGVKYALENHTDLMICDINMDGIDGYKVLELIRSSNKTKAMPFIFLTAKSNKDDVRVGMDLGADDYIPKPYTNEIVLNAVKSRLQKHNILQDVVNEEVDISKKNLASTLPHELKTPLSIIVSYSDILKTSAKNIGTDEISEIADIINISAKRLQRMFDNYTFFVDLFSFSIEDREREISITYNITSIIEEIANELIEGRNKKYNLLVEKVDCHIQMDRIHFEKLLYEIVDNAVKFSDDVHFINIETNLKDNILEIGITNSGVEFKDSDIQRIGAFKQFNRAYQEQQGIGLGLGIVKKIMEIYNYKFTIKSENGYTKVKLYIPIAY